MDIDIQYKLSMVVHPPSLVSCTCILVIIYTKIFIRCWKLIRWNRFQHIHGFKEAIWVHYSEDNTTSLSDYYFSFLSKTFLFTARSCPFIWINYCPKSLYYQNSGKKHIDFVWDSFYNLIWVWNKVARPFIQGEKAINGPIVSPCFSRNYYIWLWQSEMKTWVLAEHLF